MAVDAMASRAHVERSPSAAPTTAAPSAASSKNPWSAPKGTWPEVLTTVEANAFLGLCCVFVFWWYQDRRNVYSPRRVFRPSRVPAGLRDGLSGFLDVTRLPEDELRRKIGTDAYVLVGFLRVMRRLCVVGSLA